MYDHLVKYSTFDHTIWIHLPKVTGWVDPAESAGQAPLPALITGSTDPDKVRRAYYLKLPKWRNW